MNSFPWLSASQKIRIHWSLNIIGTLYTNPVRTSQETLRLHKKTNRLMLFGETVAVYCENHMEHIITLCGQNAELCNVIALKQLSSSRFTLLWTACLSKVKPDAACEGGAISQYIPFRRTRIQIEFLWRSCSLCVGFNLILAGFIEFSEGMNSLCWASQLWTQRRHRIQAPRPSSVMRVWFASLQPINARTVS
jgi:hypothetical protein